MNIFALVSLIAAIFCLALGILVIYQNHKPALNKIFFLTVLTGFIYYFTTIMMWAAPTAQDALLWHKLGTIWPFFSASVLTFALIFTNNHWLKNKINYIIIYLPAIAFFILDATTEYINTAPVMQSWGYNDLASGTWIYAVSSLWSSLLPLLAFGICFRYYLKAKDPTQRQRGKLVSIGLIIPISAFIITNMLTRGLDMGIPNLGPIATLFFAVFVGFAIVKYDLFTIDPTLAAENIVSTIPDSLILANMNSGMLKVNQHLVDFLGFSEEELIGQPITKLCGDNPKECTEVLVELSREKLVRNRELILQTKAGEKRYVLFSGSVVQSKSGRSLGLTCVIHDITERKMAEEELAKAQRLATIGELAGQLGHDLRNPLAGIKNGVYLVKKKGNRITEDERGEILRIIEVAIEDSNRIVTSLIEYSGDLLLTPEFCTPKSLMVDALSKVQVPGYINLENEVADETRMLLDRVRIESVFASIIQNAVQAMPEKGTLKIQSCIVGSNMEFCFEDIGVGITEDMLERLFTPLVTSKAKGMGMGLAICKRVVLAHGGKVTVESQMGVGTKVKVVLPIRRSRIEFSPALTAPLF